MFLCFSFQSEPALRKCEDLFSIDYRIIELDNINGSLSPRYPSRIFIPDNEHSHVAPVLLYNNVPNYVKFSPKIYSKDTINEDEIDSNKIREYISFAKYARCRQRFVVPVIIYKGKYICRSATTSVRPEVYVRKVLDYAYDYYYGESDPPNSTADNPSSNSPGENSEETDDSPLFSYEEVIKNDINLLRSFKVGTIVDLMVETRKQKFYLTVSTSEKADLETQYREFTLLSLPYPGCEFFTKFRGNDYTAEDLHYDWQHQFNNAELSVPEDSTAKSIDVNWEQYKNWDLVYMTQTYMKAILKTIQDEDKGVLIHCISGWDRTPLFISLVRLSLWADGLIHKSLDYKQITYLTCAYDWYLFGHQLPDRLSNGEDILYFCFHVLKYITDDQYSLDYRKRTKTMSSGSNGATSKATETHCEENGDGEDDYDNHYDHILDHAHHDNNLNEYE